MNRALAEMDLNEPSRGRAALVSTVTWSEEQKYLWSGGRIHPAFIQDSRFTSFIPAGRRVLRMEGRATGAQEALIN